jgi:multicomponent Na+:H+ antiporter subunit G
MSSVLELMAILAILTGTLFSALGVLGMLRLPDPYTRLHATGKVGVFGCVLLLIAAAFSTPLSWGRAGLLIVLLMISGPVTTHAIASAAYRLGIAMKEPIVDDLRLAEPQTTAEDA